MNIASCFYLILAAGCGLAGCSPSGENAGRAVAEPESDPLYWVAPMDPDYRRDQPGQSPMGMDLVPVYKDRVTGVDAGPGTVYINPDVVNNLGVRLATAQRRTWHSEIRTVGYVRYDEDRLLHIHPRVEGWVETLHVKAAGDPVTRGQALYELYSPELVNAQEELLLALKRNNQTLVKAAQDRLRALQMSAEFIAELQRSKQVAQTVTFRARRGGVVDVLGIREGFYVKPGTTMMSIGTLDEVWVEAEIFERQAAGVHAGLAVTMTTEYSPDTRWEGVVDYVYPALDAQTRTLRVRLRFANDDGILKPNMFAQVVIYADDEDGVLMVPRETVIRTGSQDRVVLALGEGAFKSVAIGLGRVGNEWAEILRGLEEGDQVVASAQFLLDSESSKQSDFMRMHHGDAVPDVGERP
jgi:Cu(I)/Ag(I) efflux system membrane fusion protein